MGLIAAILTPFVHSLIFTDNKWWTYAISAAVTYVVFFAIYLSAKAVLLLISRDKQLEILEKQLPVPDELFQRGQWLQARAPTVGNAGELALCRFWAEEVQGWSQRMSKLLWEKYGEEVGRDFNNNVGLNQNESIGNVHPEVAHAYRALSHQLKTFHDIRRTLPR
jgi:hypothetical protein